MKYNIQNRSSDLMDSHFHNISYCICAQKLAYFSLRVIFREKLDEEVSKIRSERRHAEQMVRDNHLIKLLVRKLIDDSVTLCLLTPRTACPECWETFERQRRLLDGNKCTCNKEEGKFCLKNVLAVNRKSKATQNYFRCCRGTVPYEFDYRKIFEDDTQRPLCPVKKAIRRALGVEQDDIDENEAVSRCMKEMWRCELKLWNEKFRKDRLETRKQEKMDNDILNLDCVDSKDPLFLQQLLKVALMKLCDDSKYVLATFPNVHQLPFLNAWMQNRHGVTQSERERREILFESQYFWEWLIPRVTAIRWPVCKDLGMHGRVSWNYKNKLERNAQTQLTKFYRKFKRLQIQENRLYWSTMDPYRTNVDRFRQIFFDYLPNCEPLIGPTVRPWKRFEFRPMESLSRMLKVCDSKTNC